MGREIEAKFRVESHQPIRDALCRLGATLDARGIEENQIFDRPDGSLRRGGQGLRLRTLRPDDGGDRRTTLTLKGPVAPGPFKSREEFEVSMDDVQTAATILDRLGFVPILAYQKRRESWLLADRRVELDEPPFIGLFVEIEGPNEAAIRQVQDQLGLGAAHHVTASYVRMLAAYCDENGIIPRVLRLPGPTQAPGGR